MKKGFLFMLFCLLINFYAQAQNNNVTGVVKDNQGNPLPYATIKIKNAATISVADSLGGFSINLNGLSNAVLMVSAVGEETKEIPVNAGDRIAVTLNMGTNYNQEVIVTALGIKREAKSLGYATASLSSKEINQSAPVNALNGITGKVSGLNIQLTSSSVDPNNLHVTLRGSRSFLGNNSPLVTIDGVPSSLTILAQLDPSDIANVDILKGSTAAALYGSQASNGVIIVTTKSGTQGKDVINISSTVTWDKVYMTPKLQYLYGPASTEYESSDPISYSDPTNLQNGYTPFENQNFGMKYNGDSVTLSYPTLDGKILRVVYAPLKDEFKKFWSNSPTYQNNVSYSGGDKKSTFYLSYQNVNRSGVMPKDKYYRNAIKFNGTRQYGIFKMAANIMFTAADMNTVSNGSSVYNQVTNLPTFIPFTSYSNTNALWGDASTYYAAYAINPYWYINNSRTDSKTNYLVGSLDMTLKPTSWVSLDYQVGVNNYYNNTFYTQAALSYNTYAWFMHNNTVSSNVATQNPQPAQVNTSSNNSLQYYSNFKLFLNRKFGNVNSQLILGNMITQNTYYSVGNSSNNLLNFPDFYNINYITGYPTAVQTTTVSRNYANYGDLSLDYQKKVFLHGSGRFESTSLLNPQYRNYFYPAVDASVVLNEILPFLQNSATLSFLKLRGGISKTGNISISPYGVQNVFSNGSGFPYGNTTGLTTPTTSTIPNLSPEFTYSQEVGLNMGLFNGRIDFQATYFNSDTKNETVTLNVSNATGYQNATRNAGQMNNKGLELDLNLVPVRLDNGFRWDLGLHYSHYSSKVVDLGGLPRLSLGTTAYNTSGNAYAVVGKPYAALMLNDWLRDSLGRVIVDANSGYPQIDPTLKYYGNTNPTNTLGINTSWTYKGFTLNIVGEYKGGNVVYNGLGNNFDMFGLSARTAQFDHTKFVFPNSVIAGPNGTYTPNTSVQLRDAGIGWWTFPQSMYMTSGAFWAIRNVSITYQIPHELLMKTRVVQQASFSLIGSNLFMKTPSSNVWGNPEFSDGGTGNGTGSNSLNQMPSARTYGASLNITF